MRLPRVRFTMRRMMAHVALIALALAFARHAVTRYGAEGVLMIAWTVILGAIDIPLFWKVSSPRFWLGFGLSGVSYLALAFFAPLPVRMPTSWLLEDLHDRLPAGVPIPAKDFMLAGHAVLSLFFGLLGGPVAILLLPARPEEEVKTERVPLRVYFPTAFSCWDWLRSGRR